MDNVTIATVITEDGISRCISATTSLARGVPDLRITGVTDRAASEIKALVLAVLKKRGVRSHLRCALRGDKRARFRRHRFYRWDNLSQLQLLDRFNFQLD